MNIARALVSLAWLFAASATMHAQSSQLPLDGPALGNDRIRQYQIEGGVLSLDEIRRKGMEIFSTPFNALDGFGDGPVDPLNPSAQGGRPTTNGTWLRVNGLDSQTCLECHSVVSNRTLPATFGVGGSAGIGGSAFPGVTDFDIDDEDANGIADVNGRLINPPFVFGAGGIELVAKEMTVDLQVLKAAAQTSPGTVVPLVTKGVSFGSISYDAGTNTFDTSAVEGVDPDLVVRPFGRKGNNSSVRAFGVGALQFHHGMQPVEVVGDEDDDGDGIANEILVGELSALHIFSVSLERPRRAKADRPEVATAGRTTFLAAGCGACHRPALQTESSLLDLSFPEVEVDPTQNVYYTVDLRNGSAGFQPNRQGGVRVELFSDLRRHDMGPSLSETTGDPLDRWYITPRLWGIADSGPYLHDGRALTLRQAIEMHAGEGTTAAAAFAGLTARQQRELLEFLGTLQTPRQPSTGL